MVKLTYRGVHYDTSSVSSDLSHPTQVDALEIDLPHQHQVPAPNLAAKNSLPVPQPVQRLTYRGVNYYQAVSQPRVAVADLPLGDRPEENASIQSRKAVPVPLQGQRSSFQPTPVPRFIESGERANVFAYLQSRLAVAKSQGDQALVALIRREMQLLC
jgi:hypothetical protein